MSIINPPGEEFPVGGRNTTVSGLQEIAVPNQDTTRVTIPTDTVPARLTDTLPDLPLERFSPVNYEDSLSVIPADTTSLLPADTLQYTRDNPQADTLPYNGVAADTIAPAMPDTAHPAIPPLRIQPVTQPVPDAAPPQQEDPPGGRVVQYSADWYLENESASDSLQTLLTSVFPGNHGRAPEPYNPFGISGVIVPHSASDNYVQYIGAGESEGAFDGPVNLTGSWVPALVLLSFFMLAWIKIIYMQFLSPMLVSAFSYKESSKLYHSRNAPARNTFIILHAIFAINGGLFLLFIANHFNLSLPATGDFVIFAGAALLPVLLFALKSAALRITGYLFEKQKLFAEYTHNVSLYNRIYGLALLPVIVGLLYAGEEMFEIFLYTGLVTGALFYVLQMYRGLEIIIRKQFSLFYLILYLCAFEILPIIVIVRLFRVLIM